MKIIIGFLVISFAHLTYAWTANKENCASFQSQIEGIEQTETCTCTCTGKKGTAEVTRSESISGINNGEKCKEECSIENNPFSPNTIDEGQVNSCTPKFIPNFVGLQEKEFEDRLARCDRFRADKDKDEEAAMADDEKKSENLKAEKEFYQAQINEARQQCHSESEQLESEVARVESEAKSIQTEIDEKEQERIRLQAMTNDEEDQLQDEYAELKRGTSKLLNDHEVYLQNENQAFDNQFKGIQIQIERLLVGLEQAESLKQDACAVRYNDYRKVEDDCHKTALASVTQRRNEYYNKLYSGEQQFGSVSEMFSNDFEMTENKFIALLNHEKSRCLDQAIGKTEIVACNLQTLEKRDTFCQKNKKPQCPIGEAAEIELKTKVQLKSAHFQIRDLDLQLNDLYQQLEELPARRTEALARLKKTLEEQKQKFEDDYAKTERDYQQAQLKRFLDIKKLTDEIQSLMEEDPTLHFNAKLKLAQNVCCQTVSNASNLMNTVLSNKDGITEGITEGIQQYMGGQQMFGDKQHCDKIREYANNVQAFQYLFVNRVIDPSTGAVVRIPRAKQSGGGR